MMNFRLKKYTTATEKAVGTMANKRLCTPMVIIL